VEGIQPRFVEFGADVFLEFIPAVLFACHWEENLCREQRAVVVVGVQRPDGDAVFAAGLQLALGGVEVVETVDFDFVVTVFAFTHFYVGLSHEPEALVVGALFFQVFGEQVGVHLRFQGGDAFGCVDVFGGFGVEGEGAKHDHFRQREQFPGFAQGIFDLALFEGGVFGAETDHHALAGIECAAAVQVARTGQGFEFGEFEHLFVFATDAGFHEFVAPLGLAGSFTTAGNAVVGLCGLRGIVKWQHGGEWHGFERKRAGDAPFVFGDLRLVVEGFLSGVGGDAVVHAALHRLTRRVESVEWGAGGF